MSAYDDYRDYLLDIEDVKTAYRSAFSSIVFPENYGVYTSAQQPIERRAPGTPISSSIWNSTINELRGICCGIAKSMNAYNQGVEEAFEIFVQKINDMMTHLLEVDYEEFMRFITNASFDAAFTYDVEDPEEETPSECFLNLYIGLPEDPERITVTSKNLFTPQLIWDAAVDPEPVDSAGNPIWRVKIDSSAPAIDSSFITRSELTTAINEQAVIDARTYATKTELSDAIAARVEEEGAINERIDDANDDIAELQDTLGDRESASEYSSNTVWQAIHDIKVNSNLDPELVEDMEDLQTAKEDLLNMITDITHLQNEVTPLRSRLETVIDYYNQAILNLRKKIAGLSAFGARSYMNTEGQGTVYTLDTSDYWNIAATTKSAISFLTATTTGTTSENAIRTDGSSVYLEARSGVCTIHGTVLTGGTSYALDGTYILPICVIPPQFIPNTTDFDTPTVTFQSGGELVTCQILVRSASGANSYKLATTGSNYSLDADKHVLAITCVRKLSDGTTKKLTSGRSYKFAMSYLTRGDLYNDSKQSTIPSYVFTTPIAGTTVPVINS